MVEQAGRNNSSSRSVLCVHEFLWATNWETASMESVEKPLLNILVPSPYLINAP